MRLNALRQRLEAALAERRSVLEQADFQYKLMAESIDVTLPGEHFSEGHLHLITQIRREVEDVFLGLGYTIVDGREVETTHYNFDGLNMPPWHPTRSPGHSLFLNGDVLLRTEPRPHRFG